MPDYSLYEDQQLLSCLAQDDTLAFDEIYKRFWRILFAVAYRHIADIPASEDIVHDVLASLWINRTTVQARNLRNYLAVSVKYLVLRKLRRLELQRRYQQDHNAITFSQTDPENSLKYKQILETVQSEVDKLPEKCRLVFKYSREMGMSSEEIATQMNISPNTVKNHLVKALRLVRNGLKDSFQSFFTLF